MPTLICQSLRSASEHSPLCPHYKRERNFERVCIITISASAAVLPVSFPSLVDVSVCSSSDLLPFVFKELVHLFPALCQILGKFDIHDDLPHSTRENFPLAPCIYSIYGKRCLWQLWSPPRSFHILHHLKVFLVFPVYAIQYSVAHSNCEALRGSGKSQLTHQRTALSLTDQDEIRRDSSNGRKYQRLDRRCTKNKVFPDNASVRGRFAIFVR